MKHFFDLPEPTAAELAEIMQFAKLMAKIARHGDDGREYRPPTACVIPLPDEIAPPAPRRPRRRVISLAE